MSDIPIAQLADWLTQEIGKALEKNTKTAQKLIQERLKIIEDMTTAITKLEDYATSELKKGSQQLVKTTRSRSTYKVARHLAEFSSAFQTALESLNLPNPQVPTPDEVYQFYDSSVYFSRDAKVLFSKFRVILAAPWIRSRKEAKKLRDSFLAFIEKRKELKKFLDDHFFQNQEVEIFLRRLAQLQTSHQALTTTQQELKTLQIQEQDILERRQELENQLKTLQTNSSFREWEQIQKTKHALERKLLKLVNPLKRALKKVENQTETVQSLFTPRALAQIGNYLEEPYCTFTHDIDGPEVLLEIARGIKESIQTEKLVIDKVRGRKGLEAANRVLQNPQRLYRLMEAHRDLEAAITQFQSSPATEALFKAITQIEDQSREVKQARKEITRRQKRIKANLVQEQKRVAEQKTELEKMARELTSKPLQIVDA